MRYGFPDADAKQLGLIRIGPRMSSCFCQKLKENNIKVDSASVARGANAVLASWGAEPVRSMRSSAIVGASQLGVADSERYIRHDLGVQQLIAVLVCPADW
jgi:hypothetical protein